MIIVTGGAGFIGSALVWKLNEMGFRDIVIVDHLGETQKWRNIAKRNFANYIHKDSFSSWLKSRPKGFQVECIFHLGACSSTVQKNVDYLMENNLHYSMELFEWATKEKVPFIYASSAATYGAGTQGFSDNPETLPKLLPINPYGLSKHVFDKWVLRQRDKPPFWCGLKFFNVYGPNEYHKDGQMSVAYQAFQQIKDTKVLRLFKSYKSGVPDGEQKRDFVYVKDVVDVMIHLFHASSIAVSGIYNLGTGRAQSFLELGRAVFKAMGGKTESIEWIEMPPGLKEQYQYFTEANMERLRAQTAYKKPFTSIDEGVQDYVRNYLMQADPYL